MHAAEVRFVCRGGIRHETTDAISALLGAWIKNGQVVDGNWPMAVDGEVLRVFVSLPAADSLADEHMNECVRREAGALAQLGVVGPVVEVMPADPTVSEPCDCGKTSWLVLFTHCLSSAPPFRCGSCFGYVPLYLLPHTESDEYLSVLSWQADYKACDTLQLHCATGERFAERQLLEVNSSLAKVGRRLCRELEAVSGVPVYYFLFKARGRSRRVERARTCPVCGAFWLLDTPLFGLFDFKCDSCKLVSNIASNVA